VRINRSSQGIILFILLEILAIALTIASNKSKRIFVINGISKIFANAYSWSFSIQNYFSLKKENIKLLKSNQTFILQKLNCKKTSDTIYSLVLANVIKNSINHSNNLLIISAGKNQGIKPQDGVISAQGYAVGTVISCGKNYSAVLSLLNKTTAISVLHKPSNTFAILKWNGVSPLFATVENIPTYIKLHIGDSIVTSGYSTIFPKGILVGTVASFSKNSHYNTYKIKVKLAEDFRRLQYVFVIKNKDKPQILSLIKKAETIINK
jgi:rod shape-determining protein MreC